MYILSHCKYQVNPHSSPWFSAACAAAIVHGNHFFHIYKQNKSESTKGFLKLRVHLQKPCSLDFWWLANNVLNKGKYAIPPLFRDQEVLSSASENAKLFAKNFSQNCQNLDDSGISLPIFPSRINLKLHNISVTPKMVKKVILNLYSSKISGPDCIPVVVPKNCEPELSYTLAELFNMCLN